MTASNPFKFADVHTNRGAMHMAAGQAVGQGQPDIGVFTTSGIFVDRETLTIGTAAGLDDDIYAIVDLSTDSGDDILTFWNNTDPEVTQTGITTGLLAVGEYVAVESEIAIVTHVITAATDTVSFARGMAGTTIVAHGTGTDPIEIQEATALVAGTITVPTIAVTAAAGLDALAAIIGNDANRSPQGNGAQGRPTLVDGLVALKQSNWRFINTDDTVGLLISTVGGSRAVTLAEAGTNTAWDATPTYNGANAQSNVNMVVSRVPTAEEVTAGAIIIPLNFTPEEAKVAVYTTATDAIVAWDGAVVYDRTLNTITVGNGGLVDWAATDTVTVHITGVVDVADAAVIG